MKCVGELEMEVAACAPVGTRLVAVYRSDLRDGFLVRFEDKHTGKVADRFLPQSTLAESCYPGIHLCKIWPWPVQETEHRCVQMRKASLRWFQARAREAYDQQVRAAKAKLWWL